MKDASAALVLFFFFTFFYSVPHCSCLYLPSKVVELMLVFFLCYFMNVGIFALYLSG